MSRLACQQSGAKLLSSVAGNLFQNLGVVPTWVLAASKCRVSEVVLGDQVVLVSVVCLLVSCYFTSLLQLPSKLQCLCVFGQFAVGVSSGTL